MESLIRLEASLGHSVHVVALNTEKHWVEHPASSIQGATLEAVAASTKPSVRTALSNLFSRNSYYASRFWTPEASAVIAERVQRADVVVLDSMFMAVYLNELGTVPVILRAHNVEHAIWMRGLSDEPWFRRGYVALQAQRLKVWESQVAQRVARIWTISPEDAAWFRRFGPVHTLPCTYDPEHGTWTETGAAEPTAYHLGALDWTPNVRGMKWFLEEVAPLLHHAGVDVYSRQWPFGSAPKGVRYRADQPDFAEYGIFIAPIRSGSGMRIKLLEAMARGKAIVTTPLGAEGLNAIQGTHLLMADSPSEFAAAMDELHQNAELRSKLGSAAALHARTQFSYHSAADGIARELATFAS